jgi:hypothetical protein
MIGALPRQYTPGASVKGITLLNDKVKLLNDKVKNICDREGVKFVNFGPTFKNNSEYYNIDGINLGKIGQEKLGRLLNTNLKLIQLKQKEENETCKKKWGKIKNNDRP